MIGVESQVDSLLENYRRSGFARIALESNEVDLAIDVFSRFCDALACKQLLPSKYEILVDDEQITEVPQGCTRNLLPHFDSAHSSFPTPSKLDVPNWSESHRVTADKGYTAGAQHRLIQALLITNSGPGNAQTGFYPFFSMLKEASKRLDVRDDVKQRARLMGSRIVEWRKITSSDRDHAYLPIPVLLGVPFGPLWTFSPHCAEAPLPASLDNYVNNYRSEVECEDCRTGVNLCEHNSGRLFCIGIREGLGLSMPEFRAKYETRIESKTADLVVFCNIALLHSGLSGAEERRILPISATINDASGDEYERWLHDLWRWRI